VIFRRRLVDEIEEQLHVRIYFGISWRERFAVQVHITSSRFPDFGLPIREQLEHQIDDQLDEEDL
jgi:hypothetical protein